MGLQTAQQQSRALRIARRFRRWLAISCLLTLVGTAFWLYASITELQTGRRLWPWSAYALCGSSQPATLPQTVRVGLYEEFPNPDTFRRNLQIARAAGVSEVWIFGANGLNDDYLRALREELPLEQAPVR